MVDEPGNDAGTDTTRSNRKVERSIDARTIYWGIGGVLGLTAVLAIYFTPPTEAIRNELMLLRRESAEVRSYVAIRNDLGPYHTVAARARVDSLLNYNRTQAVEMRKVIHRQRWPYRSLVEADSLLQDIVAQTTPQNSTIPNTPAKTQEHASGISAPVNGNLIRALVGIHPGRPY